MLYLLHTSHWVRNESFSWELRNQHDIYDKLHEMEQRYEILKEEDDKDLVVIELFVQDNNTPKGWTLIKTWERDTKEEWSNGYECGTQGVAIRGH